MQQTIICFGLNIFLILVDIVKLLKSGLMLEIKAKHML